MGKERRIIREMNVVFDGDGKYLVKMTEIQNETQMSQSDNSFMF